MRYELFDKSVVADSPVVCPICGQTAFGVVYDSSTVKSNATTAMLHPCLCEVDPAWLALLLRELDRRSRGLKPLYTKIPTGNLKEVERLCVAELADLYSARDSAYAQGDDKQRVQLETVIVDAANRLLDVNRAAELPPIEFADATWSNIGNRIPPIWAEVSDDSIQWSVDKAVCSVARDDLSSVITFVKHKPQLVLPSVLSGWQTSTSESANRIFNNFVWNITTGEALYPESVALINATPSDIYKPMRCVANKCAISAARAERRARYNKDGFKQCMGRRKRRIGPTTKKE